MYMYLIIIIAILGLNMWGPPFVLRVTNDLQRTRHLGGTACLTLPV